MMCLRWRNPLFEIKNSYEAIHKERPQFCWFFFFFQTYLVLTSFVSTVSLTHKTGRTKKKYPLSQHNCPSSPGNTGKQIFLTDGSWEHCQCNDFCFERKTNRRVGSGIFLRTLCYKICSKIVVPLITALFKPNIKLFPNFMRKVFG